MTVIERENLLKNGCPSHIVQMLTTQCQALVSQLNWAELTVMFVNKKLISTSIDEPHLWQKISYETIRGDEKTSPREIPILC